ncbi:ABC-type nitrate/sulfonate/bicarbonate transport system, permease component [Micromonospora phaseoli]|uniref:ABC-type nitrate/sulfonate/bicarbonate transport system, permease component n=1 Tax=Micromonospora phaseoli TaxID=1144548 RepID=A0A1H6UV86_9ACTN|nr:ABC transporter permease [Micromonospora phaseoli]PZV99035.1 ABC-type nitrate/sulfonate/bicarbonate transport system permease component [Micromonospora phaseoli]GIJ76211.1 nitrate ABC transporter permease [Micromonospora phaseoli]SEI92250.1 ABC-type nitrate/sulfonate/bicarbonate transport system, permease component [Micromonospora phaseoli]
MTAHTGSVASTARGRGIGFRVGASFLHALGLPFLLLVIWGVATSTSTNRFFPGPLTIFEAFVDTWVGPAFVEDVLPSLYRLGFGILASIVVGVAVGTLIGLVRWLRELLEPLLEFFRAIPPPVLIPVVMLLLGITDTMKVVVIVSGAIWPILLNTIDGVRATDSVMTETADSFQVTWWERLRFLVLPAASPRIMAGVRQGLSVALILMVISEMFASSSGLGYRIAYFQRNYLIAEMWSGILLLGLVGVFLAVAFGVVERRVLRWYHGIREVSRA